MTAKPILQTGCAEEEPPASPTKRELFELLLQSGGATQCVSIEWIESFANAVLARWGNPAPPPADGEVAELVAWLREQLHVCLQAPVMVPVAVSDALIKAECALSDIAEGEPMADEGDPLKWAERRCADTLAIIRPTMMQHKIRTSEWPPVVATAKPLPEVGE